MVGEGDERPHQADSGNTPGSVALVARGGQAKQPVRCTKQRRHHGSGAADVRRTQRGAVGHQRQLDGVGVVWGLQRTHEEGHEARQVARRQGVSGLQGHDLGEDAQRHGTAACVATARVVGNAVHPRPKQVQDGVRCDVHKRRGESTAVSQHTWHACQRQTRLPASTPIARTANAMQQTPQAQAPQHSTAPCTHTPLTYVAVSLAPGDLR